MASWTPEVENRQHLTIENEDWIVCSAAYTGTPINALYSRLTIEPPNRYYFEFEFDQIDQSLFVGLTTTDAFKSGYELKGKLNKNRFQSTEVVFSFVIFRYLSINAKQCFSEAICRTEVACWSATLASQFKVQVVLRSSST